MHKSSVFKFHTERLISNRASQTWQQDRWAHAEQYWRQKWMDRSLNNESLQIIIKLQRGCETAKSAWGFGQDKWCLHCWRIRADTCLSGNLFWWDLLSGRRRTYSKCHSKCHSTASKKKKKQDVLKAVASSPQISNRHHCHQVYLKFHRDTEESEEVHVHYQ